MQIRRVNERGLLPTEVNDSQIYDSPIAPHPVLVADNALPSQGSDDLPPGNGSVTVLKGTAAPDTIHGSDGADAIFGLGGADVLYGGEGDDRIEGGDGDDRLYGGANDDILYGGSGADRLDGGDGIDTVSYDGAASGVTVNLSGGGVDPENDVTVGGGFGGEAKGDIYLSIENVIGSSFDDKMIGDCRSNVLMGGHGDDEIVGGAGEDRLIGGPGRDTLTGDGDGSINADTFAIHGWRGGLDTITDFQQGVDKIEIGGLPPGLLGDDGELAWGWRDEQGVHAQSFDANDKLFFDTASKTLYYCVYSEEEGTFTSLKALVTVNDDVARLAASDLILV